MTRRQFTDTNDDPHIGREAAASSDYFENFSAGYYLTRLYVEPSQNAHATITQETHEQVTSQLYETEEAEIVNLDTPLVMKHNQNHHLVYGNPETPLDTLTIPEDQLDTENTPYPQLAENFLAKAKRIQMLQYCIPKLTPHSVPSNLC